MDHMKFPCLPLSEIDLFSIFSVFFRPEYIFPIGDFGPDPVFPIGVFRPDPDCVSVPHRTLVVAEANMSLEPRVE